MIKSTRSGFLGLGVLFALARAAQAREPHPVATAGTADDGSGSASLPQQRPPVNRMVLLFSGARYYGSVEQEVAGSHVVLKLVTGESRRFPAQEVLKLVPLDGAGVPFGNGPSAPQRSVVLMDGTSLRGELVEYVPGDHLTLLLVDGAVRRIELAQVRQIGQVPSASDAASEAPRRPNKPVLRSPLEEWTAAQRQRARHELRAGAVLLPLGTVMMLSNAGIVATNGEPEKLGAVLFFGAALGPTLHLAGIGAIAAGGLRLRNLDRGGPEYMTAEGRWLLTRGSIVSGVGLGISLLSLSALAARGPSSGPGTALGLAIPLGFGAPLLLIGGYMMAIGGSLMSDPRSPSALSWRFSPYLSPQSVGLTWSLMHK